MKKEDNQGDSANDAGQEGSTLAAVSALMDERRRFEAWIAALEARRSTTPDHVFARVHADYTARLEAVIRQLTTHTEGLRHELDTLSSRLGQDSRRAPARRGRARRSGAARARRRAVRRRLGEHRRRERRQARRAGGEIRRSGAGASEDARSPRGRAASRDTADTGSCRVCRPRCAEGSTGDSARGAPGEPRR